MTVKIYTEANNSNSALSLGGSFTNPFSLTFDGRTGGFKEVKLFLRNDSADYYYEDLQVSLQDLSDETITDNLADGYAWKLSAGDTKPTFNDWANIAPANTINLGTLGESGSADTSTYLPFWVFVQVPSNISIQAFTNVSFIISGQENLIEVGD